MAVPWLALTAGIGILSQASGQERLADKNQQIYDLITGELKKIPAVQQSLMGVKESIGDVYRRTVGLKAAQMEAPLWQLGSEYEAALGQSGFASYGALDKRLGMARGTLFDTFMEERLNAQITRGSQEMDVEQRLQELEQERQRLLTQRAGLDTSKPQGLGKVLSTVGSFLGL